MSTTSAHECSLIAFEGKGETETSKKKRNTKSKNTQLLPNGIASIHFDGMHVEKMYVSRALGWLLRRAEHWPTE